MREAKSQTVYGADYLYQIEQHVNSLKPSSAAFDSFKEFDNSSEKFKKLNFKTTAVEVPTFLQEGATGEQVNAKIAEVNKAIAQLAQAKKEQEKIYGIMTDVVDGAVRHLDGFRDKEVAKSSLYSSILPIAKNSSKLEDILSSQKRDISRAQKRAGDMGNMVLDLQKGYAHLKKWSMSWQSRPTSIGTLADYLRFVEGTADPGESVRRMTEMYERERSRLVAEARGEQERKKPFIPFKKFNSSEKFYGEKPGRPFSSGKKFTPQGGLQNWKIRCFDCNKPGFTTKNCPSCNSKIGKSRK